MKKRIKRENPATGNGTMEKYFPWFRVFRCYTEPSENKHPSSMKEKEKS